MYLISFNFMLLSLKKKKKKVKDAFVTSMLLQYAMSRMQPKDVLKLNGLQNMMLATDARPKPLFCKFMLYIISYLCCKHLIKQ
jgi:hypothetical protein